MEVDCEIQPFRIDDLKSKVEIAITAIEGGILSKRTGVVMAGVVDEIEEELQEIEADATEAEWMSIKNKTTPQGGNSKEEE